MGDYVVTLDSDDYWDVTFLEQLYHFAVGEDLDIACTGVIFENVDGKRIGERSIPKQILIDTNNYANFFPVYHGFFRTHWAKLYKKKIFLETALDGVLANYLEQGLSYGGDTIFTFGCLRRCLCHGGRAGIAPSAMYHYLMRERSVSYDYSSTRFDSDIYLYNDAVDFLKSHGHVSLRNQVFLYVVYANAIRDTMGIILNAKLTPAEKIHEYAAIAVHPITQMAYRCSDTACRRSRETLLALICAEGLKLATGEDDEDLQRALQVLLPRCGPAATGKNLPVFLSSELEKKFLSDDRDGVVDTLLNLLPQIPNLQKYDLGTAMGRLAADKLLLFQISDLTFLMKYPDLYRLIWMGENDQALDQMTGDLLDGQVLHAKETFLNLYINLAAHQGQESAFLFGKIQLAQFYCKRRRWVEAIQVLDDLEEMGAGELEEVHDLRTVLEEEKVQ